MRGEMNLDLSFLSASCGGLAWDPVGDRWLDMLLSCPRRPEQEGRREREKERDWKLNASS